jgi:hypothetical protein
VNYRANKLSESAQKLRRQIKRKLIKLGKLDEVQVVKVKKEAPKKSVKAAA